MPNHIDQDYEIKGLSGETYSARVVITQDAWDKADQDVQNQTNNILANTPIQLLSIKGKGNGFKRQSDGWSIHTQSDKRLYATNDMGPAPHRFEFNTYKKPPHSGADQSDHEHTTMPRASATAESDSTPILNDGGDTPAQAPTTLEATPPRCAA